MSVTVPKPQKQIEVSVVMRETTYDQLLQEPPPTFRTFAAAAYDVTIDGVTRRFTLDQRPEMLTVLEAACGATVVFDVPDQTLII